MMTVHAFRFLQLAIILMAGCSFLELQAQDRVKAFPFELKDTLGRAFGWKILRVRLW